MIQPSDHFTLKRLLRFVVPSIAMLVFTSIYSVVDGFFVSNFVGKTQFAAVNLIMPILMGLGSVGFMIGSGGTAIVSKTMGEGDNERAQSYFSMLVVITVIAAVVLTTLGQLLLTPILKMFGASGELLTSAVTYGRILLFGVGAFMLQNVFQLFFNTAAKPMLGFIVTVCAGVANMVLDFLLIAVFKFGIAGAALATVISQLIGGIIPIFYFAKKNNSLLRFRKFKFDGAVILKTCTNGSSELLSNISASLVGILYNIQLLKYAGENGVDAYGVLMYVNFIFIAIFLGYSIGVAPIIGYNYGAKNTDELKNVYKKSLVIIGVLGVVLAAAAEALAYPLANLFVGYDRSLFELTIKGFRISSISFLFCGFSIFASAFFTALGNGAISAISSVLRTLVFQTSTILIIPLIFKMDGIWAAMIIAEFLALIVNVCFLVTKRKKYNYA